MNDTGQKNSFNQFPKAVEFEGHPPDFAGLSDRLNLGIGNNKISKELGIAKFGIFFFIYRTVLNNNKND